MKDKDWKGVICWDAHMLPLLLPTPTASPEDKLLQNPHNTNPLYSPRLRQWIRGTRIRLQCWKVEKRVRGRGQSE